MKSQLFAPVLAILSVGFVSSAIGQQPAAPAPAASQAPEVTQMQHMEDLWDDALAKRDQYGLELVLAPQFIDIASNGDVTTRNQQIARLFLKEIGSPAQLKQKVVTVRMFGDLAIVNGTYTMQKHDNGALVEERGVFSHVFQRVRTAWQCVNSQRTVVVEENLTKSKKKNNNPSPAELPMHVPLVYKGADPAPPATAPPAAQPKP